MNNECKAFKHLKTSSDDLITTRYIYIVGANMNFQPRNMVTQAAMRSRSRHISLGAGAARKFWSEPEPGYFFLDGAGAGAVPNLHDFASREPEPEPEPSEPVHFAPSRSRSCWDISLGAKCHEMTFCPFFPLHFTRSRRRSCWDIFLGAGAGAGIVFRGWSGSRSRSKFAWLRIPAHRQGLV